MASRAAVSRTNRLADPVRRAAIEKERVVMRRGGKAVAAVVPIEDLRFLERLENRIDLAEAKRALADPRRIPYERLRKKLGLQVLYRKGADALYRVRVGDYRIVYEVRDDVVVIVIVRVGHRREVYRGL